VSAQELTYPQKSCCGAPTSHVALEPSGFALMVAKSLILLRTPRCRQIGQASHMPGKSMAWMRLPHLAHKVIHKICGQREKRFSIIGLGAFPHMNPSFPVQLGLPAP
jgi:hypothetical protein